MKKSLLVLANGIIIFILGLEVEIYFGWVSVGYAASRVGMIVFAIGMLAYMVRAFRPKNENPIL